jgi:hypothetical protein
MAVTRSRRPDSRPRSVAIGSQRSTAIDARGAGGRRPGRHEHTFDLGEKTNGRSYHLQVGGGWLSPELALDSPRVVKSPSFLQELGGAPGSWWIRVVRWRFVRVLREGRLRGVTGRRIGLCGSGVRCWRCGKFIAPGSPWDLGHHDHDRSIYMGAEHRKCNRGTSARRAAVRRVRRWSRAW